MKQVVYLIDGDRKRRLRIKQALEQGGFEVRASGSVVPGTDYSGVCALIGVGVSTWVPTTLAHVEAIKMWLHLSRNPTRRVIQERVLNRLKTMLSVSAEGQ